MGSPRKYCFTAVENGNELWVSFDVMMAQDAAGYLTINGQDYRRCRSREDEPCGQVRQRVTKASPPIISDNLGFPTRQLADFENDRRRNGIRGIEFEADPHVPEFTRVRADTSDAYMHYARHRGFEDKNSRNGSACQLSPDQLRRAEAMVRRNFGEKEKKPQSCRLNA